MEQDIGEVVLPSGQLAESRACTGLEWRGFASMLPETESYSVWKTRRERPGVALWATGNPVPAWELRKQCFHPTQQFHTPSTKHTLGPLLISNASGTLAYWDPNFDVRCDCIEVPF